jgi:hypothetical protein
MTGRAVVFVRNLRVLDRCRAASGDAAYHHAGGGVCRCDRGLICLPTRVAPGVWWEGPLGSVGQVRSVVLCGCDGDERRAGGGG